MLYKAFSLFQIIEIGSLDNKHMCTHVVHTQNPLKPPETTWKHLKFKNLGNTRMIFWAMLYKAFS